MAIQKTESIWHNGKLIPWDEAQIHVMSHVVNYGSSIFEGIRCYSLPTGPAIFRPRNTSNVCWIRRRFTASTLISPAKNWSRPWSS